MIKQRGYALVLASGGIDSSACINFYKKLGFKVEAYFIDYGQKARIYETKAVKRIAKYFNVTLKVIRIKTAAKFGVGEVLGRNAFLIYTALLCFNKKSGIIALGLHKGTNYYDSSKEFIALNQIIFDKYSDGAVKMGTPFIDFNKKEIYDYCLSENMPLNLTYSCEAGTKHPCGNCATCKDLVSIYASTK